MSKGLSLIYIYHLYLILLRSNGTLNPQLVTRSTAPMLLFTLDRGWGIEEETLNRSSRKTGSER